MRYQERIYIQNENGAVRNKDILNVNMSSDICVFDTPLFYLSGASKLDCTGSTSGTSYVITGDTETIPLEFNFTANTNSFVNTNAKFKFGIYKYTPIFSGFSTTPVYMSPLIDYSAFSATNITTQNVVGNNLSLDGDYIVKGFYQFSACTGFLNKIGKNFDTSNYLGGTQYGIYNNDLDYYFIAIKQAEKPIFVNNDSNNTGINKLIQRVLPVVDKQTVIPLPTNILGDFVLTLNGLVLAPDLDYAFSGGSATLSGETFEDDIVTVIYTSTGGNNLISDVIDVNTAITSGATDGEGANLIYYNTTTNRYEIYTSVTPLSDNTLLVMVNGASLAFGIDFYQSISNPKRIILEGDIMVDDIITIVYFPIISVANGLDTTNPIVTWTIPTPPSLVNGYFSLEVSTANTFSSFYYSGTTDYVIGVNYYDLGFTASGTVGTQLFYRVKNEKNYTTICGDNLNTTAYSDIIPVIIQTNSINSY